MHDFVLPVSKEILSADASAISESRVLPSTYTASFINNVHSLKPSFEWNEAAASVAQWHGGRERVLQYAWLS